MKAIHIDNTLNNLFLMGINPGLEIPSDASSLLRFDDLYQTFITRLLLRENFQQSPPNTANLSTSESTPKIATDVENPSTGLNPELNVTEPVPTDAEQTMSNNSNQEKPNEQLRQIIRQSESRLINTNNFPGQTTSDFFWDSIPETVKWATSETMEQTPTEVHNLTGLPNNLINNLAGKPLPVLPQAPAQPNRLPDKQLNNLPDIADQNAAPLAKAAIPEKESLLIEQSPENSQIISLTKSPIRVPANENLTIPFLTIKTTTNHQHLAETLIQNMPEVDQISIPDSDTNPSIQAVEDSLLSPDTEKPIIQGLNGHISEKQSVEAYVETGELQQAANHLRKSQLSESQNIDQTKPSQTSENLKTMQTNPDKIETDDYHPNRKSSENDHSLRSNRISYDKELPASTKNVNSSCPEIQPHNSEIERDMTDQIEKKHVNHNTEIFTKSREPQPVSTRFETTHQANLNRPTQTVSVNQLPETALNRNLYPIINHISNLVIQSLKTGRNTLNVRIATDTLGEIEFRFVNKIEENRGTIIVNSEKTQSLIQKCLPSVQENLYQKEIFFASLEVEINPSNQRKFNSDHQGKSAEENLNFQANPKITQTKTTKIHDFGYNSIEIVA